MNRSSLRPEVRDPQRHTSEPLGARRRRVLIVSHVFPPAVAGGAPRMGQFARMLPEHGWDVTVLTATHKGADEAAAQAAAASATIIGTWSPASAMIRRGAATPKRGFQASARSALRMVALSLLFPDREVLWIPGALAAGRKALQASHHDAVLATYGPASDLVLGHALAREFRLPLIVDFRDLWSTLPMARFTTRVHRAAARRLERAIVRDASRIIAVAPQMAADLAAVHGVDKERALAITNGFDPHDLSRVRDTREGTERSFRLKYTGSVHAYYDLEPFWRAVRALADSGRIRPETFRIEFVGNLARADVRAHGIEAFIDTRPFVGHAEVFSAFGDADALLVIETPGYYARYSYAAKVFDYLLTGKPVLALVEPGGNTARLLGDAGVGYCVDPRDQAGIRRTLEDVLERKGVAPRAVSCEEPPLVAFNRQHLVARLASVLDEIVATEPRGSWR